MKFPKSIASLANALNVPRNLSPLELEKLRASLTSSFRGQLDLEHPPPKTTDGSSQQSQANLKTLIQAANASATPAESHARRPPKPGAVSSRSADRHVRSFLTHPLFASPSASQSSASDSSCPLTAGKGETKPVDANTTLIAWFDEHVRRGTVTLDRAFDFLDISYQNIVRDVASEANARLVGSPDTSSLLARKLKESGVGSKVATWAWSSGQKDTPNFFERIARENRLVPFLLAEETTSIFLGYIYRRNPSEHHLKLAGRLLRQIVLTEKYFHSGSVNAALEVFRLFVEHEKTVLAGGTSQPPLDISEERMKIGRKHFYLPAGMALANMLLKMDHLVLSRPLVNSFVDVLPLWADDPTLWEARIRLRHGPRDLSPAMRELRRIASRAKSATHDLASLNDDALLPSEAQGPFQANRRNGEVYLGLESAGELILQEKYDDAAWVLSLLQHEYRAELGFPSTKLSYESAIAIQVHPCLTGCDEHRLDVVLKRLNTTLIQRTATV